MRKSRTVVKDFDAKIHHLLVESPDRVFDYIEDLELRIPTWAKALVLVVPVDRQCLELVLFEDVQDFFLYYTRRMIDWPSRHRINCFSVDEVTRTWKMFVPPTLIGPNLKTKFRYPDENS
jgi:hypothetical protein